MAMCKVQTVSLYRLATAFHSQADSLSSMRQIQRFLAKYALELDLIARVILLCFPKRGNSNTEERKQIMNRFIRLFGKSANYTTSPPLTLTIVTNDNSLKDDAKNDQ